MSNKEPIYSAEQIRIPLKFPDILKNYSKFIIKTQPDNIIDASAEYFMNLKRQQELGQTIDSQICIGREQLETIYFKCSLKGQSSLAKETLKDISAEAFIPGSLLNEIYKVGNWEEHDSVPWLQFWSLCCAMSAGTVPATTVLAIDILSNNGMVPNKALCDIVHYLAKTDGKVPSTKLDNCISILTAEGDYIAENTAKSIINTHLQL